MVTDFGELVLTFQRTCITGHIDSDAREVLPNKIKNGGREDLQLRLELVKTNLLSNLRTKWKNRKN